MALSHDACTGGDGAMSNHYLKMVLDDGFQGPHVEFECKADRFAICRRRPVDKQQESWGPDDELDGGGHACWIAEWIEAVGMSECFPADPDVPEVVAEVPITVGYDEGPVILSAGATAADPLPEGADLNRKVRDEIYRQLSGHYGDFNVPTPKEAQAVIYAMAGHLLNAVPDDSADDVREALGL